MIDAEESYSSRDDLTPSSTPPMLECGWPVTAYVSNRPRRKSSGVCLTQCTIDLHQLPGASIQPSCTVRDLGVAHCNHITSYMCFFHLRQLRLIRRSLTIDAAHTLMQVLIHNRLDYCKSATVFLLDCRLFSLLVCSPSSCVLLHDLSLSCQTALQFQYTCLTRYIGSAFN